MTPPLKGKACGLKLADCWEYKRMAMRLDMTRADFKSRFEELLAMKREQLTHVRLGRPSLR